MNRIDEIEDAFFDTNPYEAKRVIDDPDSAGKGTKHLLVWDRYTEPPEEMGLLIGDAIHNLRSSLDHLAFALAKSGAHALGLTMTAAEETRIQFPIVNSNVDFKRQVGRDRLKFVEPEAVAHIERRQPYNLHTLSADAAIPAIINRLDNTDKHRALHAAATATVVSRVNWPTGLRDTQLQFPSSRTESETPTEVGSFTFEIPQSEMDVPVEFSYGLVLAGGGAPAHNLIHRLEMFIDTTESMTIRPIADRFLS